MSRPAIRRSGVAAALVATALLSSCTGDDGGSTPSPTPALAESSLTSTASSVVADAVTARSNVAATGAAARKKVFTGPALQSADAWAKTLPARTATEKADAELSTTGIKVVGVSRAGDAPAQIVAQTTLKKSGAAVLVLLVSASGASDFKVAAMTPVLPDAKIDALDPLSSGSAAIGDGAGLAAKPDAVVAAFAGSVKFPNPAPTDLLAADPLTQQLQKSAAAEAKAISAQGTLTQVHEPRGLLGGLRLSGGSGALVFAQLERSDSIALRTAAKLTPAKDVTLLTGLKQITTEAKLTSNEFVAFVVPATGTARLVGFSDQLVGASGR